MKAGEPVGTMPDFEIVIAKMLTARNGDYGTIFWVCLHYANIVKTGNEKTSNGIGAVRDVFDRWVQFVYYVRL